MQPDRPPPCYQPVMDEPQLLEALAADLDGSFEVLVRAHQDRVFSIALRLLGDRSDAEDVTQDALVRAYRALGGWDDERIRTLRLGAWLATITVNLVRSRRRRPAGGPRVEPLVFLDELDHAGPDVAPSPHDQAVRHEAAEAWATRILALPERYRAPVVLRHVDGLGYDEIAEALGRPEGTVKAQVHRGLGLLRAVLDAEARTAGPSGPEVARSAAAVERPTARGPTGTRPPADPARPDDPARATPSAVPHRLPEVLR